MGTRDRDALMMPAARVRGADVHVDHCRLAASRDERVAVAIAMNRVLVRRLHDAKTEGRVVAIERERVHDRREVGPRVAEENVHPRSART